MNSQPEHSALPMACTPAAAAAFDRIARLACSAAAATAALVALHDGGEWHILSSAGASGISTQKIALPPAPAPLNPTLTSQIAEGEGGLLGALAAQLGAVACAIIPAPHPHLLLIALDLKPRSWRAPDISALADLAALAADALERSTCNTLFYAAVESMLDCLGIYSSIRNQHGEIVDFRVVYVNPAACENNQMTSEEQVGHRLLDLFPAHRGSDLFAAYCQVVETGEPLIRNMVYYRDQFGGQERTRTYDIRVVKQDDGLIICWRDITERIHAEQTLYEARNLERKRLRDVLEILPMGIFLSDSNGQLQALNTAARQIWGEPLPLAETTSEYGIYRGWDSITGELLQSESWGLSRALNYGEVQLNHELRIQAFDGAFKTILNSAMPLYDDQGKITSGVAINIDITERKLNEERLHLSEERFRTLFNTVPQLLWLSQIDGEGDLFNQRWYEFTGRAPKAADHWQSAFHIEDHRRLIEMLDAEQHSSTPYSMEMRICRHDGAYVWHEVRLQPLHNSQGVQTAWLGAATDIHQRKRETQALSFLSEVSMLLNTALNYQSTIDQIFHLLVPTMADYAIVRMLDTDGKFLPARGRHHNPAKQDALDTFLKEYRPERDNMQHIVSEVLASGTAMRINITSDFFSNERPNPPEVKAIVRLLAPTSIITAPMVARGQALGVLTVAYADSGRSYDEDDLTVVKVVAARFALAINNAWLYSQARNAVREREELLSVASHELKTPLTSLIGYAGLLQRRTDPSAPLGEREQHYIHTIAEQGNRLMRMLDVLLDVARLDSGRLVLQRFPLDLTQIISSVIDDMTPMLSQHTIHFDQPSRPVILFGDELRLDQVVRNLISNAVKYTPQGGPVLVHVTCEEHEVYLAVQDHGIGIPADAIPTLFNRFSRARNVEDGQISGLGLGLYVVKEIVQLHGGTISVQSHEGQGSIFSICLPLARRKEQSA